MERNDQSAKGPEVSENTLGEERLKEEPRPARPHWKELFKGMVQKILLACK
jgi:hypothetical protein